MATSLDEQIQQRRVNLAELGKLGIDVYPRSFERRHTISDLVAEHGSHDHDTLEAAQPTTVTSGRILAIRAFGKANFLVLSDGRSRIQVYIRQDSLPELDFKIYKLLDFGDWVGVEGRLFRTKTNELTIWASRLHFLAKCLLPLPEKWHGLTDVETRYRQRYVDLIVNPESRRVFETRSRVVSAIREFMTARGYLEVETPMMQPIAGGAIARPFITHHNVLDMPLYLRIAPELYLKRLIVGGLERVYEFARTFRNEGIDRSHNPEFTMMECYQAYADYQEIMRLVEDMYAYVAEHVTGSKVFTYLGTQIDITPPWKRLTLHEAIAEYTGIDYEAYPERAELAAAMREHGFTVDPKLGRGRLIDELKDTVIKGETAKIKEPLFLYDYPRDISPLAKPKPGAPGVAERFQAFAGGLELGNAFTELNDPLEQRLRFEDQARQRATGDDEAQVLDEDYIEALEYGMPPTGGWGGGIDRLTMLLTNQESIRDVILFPTLREQKQGQA
ncbi:MAG TPA: lysine--tRNA ligase [Vicinamibacterales bacterium]